MSEFPPEPSSSKRPALGQALLNALQSDWSAWIVLAGSLALTGAVWWHSERTDARIANERFNTETEKLQQLILGGIDDYRLLLRSVGGQFAAHDQVSRSEWSQFINSLRLDERFSGIQGIGYAAVFGAGDKSAYEQRMRADGLPEFTVHPAGNRERYCAVTYLEPYSRRSDRTLGYDMCSEPTRRLAMENAAQIGRSALSGKVRLTQEGGKEAQPGFLMYFPVYRHNQQLDSSEERRAQLRGFVYGVFRAKDMLSGITGDEHLQIDYALYDGDTASAESLLYQTHDLTAAGSAQPRYLQQQTLRLPGRTWTVRYAGTPAFEQAVRSREPLMIAAFGLLTDALLFTLMRSFTNRRKRIETRAHQLVDQLRQGEQRQRDLFDISPNGMLLVNAQGTILLANRQIRQLFGYTPEELIGASIDQLLPERYRKNHSALRQAYQQQPETRLMNLRPVLLGLRKDGSEFPLEVGLSPMGSGGNTQVLAAIVDVTERQRAEAEVARARALLHGSVNGAETFAIIATDTDGLITLFSAGAEKMLGYQAAEVVGIQTPAILHQPQEIVARAQQLSAELGRPIDGFATLVALPLLHGSEAREWLYVRKDGTVLPVTLTVTVIRNPHGEPEGFVGVAYDISHQKQAEAELRAAKIAAEAASQAKSDFLANMSHEICTPLNAVLGMAHLLENTGLADSQHEYVAQINQAGKSLLGIINDILDFSKIEAGKLELQPVAFNLADMIDSLSSIMSINAAHKDIELIIHIARDVPQHLYGDSLRLQQVLTNLVANAIKFTEHGEVILQVNLLGSTDDRTQLCFSVRDTGIGISAGQIERLFSPFTQADNSMTRRFGGTGLGLVICKRLVALMGGEIGVHSEPGHGSEFWFSLPLALQTETSAATGPGAAMTALRVLVVDDHPASRQFIGEIVESLGWSVTSAASGQEALQCVAALEPGAPDFDLVLLDLKMPGLDGLQTGAALRRQAACGNLPIVLMATAYAREEYLLSPDAAAIDTFLCKPVTHSTLFNAAIEARNRHHAAGDAASSVPLQQECRFRPATVLLVEDNRINQMVAHGMLERAGLSLDVTDNGAEGVEALRAAPQRYALVLMDVQMPVMDGYSATRLIRSELQLDLPIIAVSAGVTRAERDQCLACGMNDFVAKPIDANQLLQVLGQYLPTLPAETATAIESAAPAPALTLQMHSMNLDRALISTGHDRNLLRLLLQRFQTEAGSLIEQVQQSLQAGQYRDAARLLHTAKGTAATLGADALAAAAKQAELAVRAQQPQPIDAALRHCAAELQPVLDELRQILPQLTLPAPQPAGAVEQLDQAQLELLLHELTTSNMAALDRFVSLQGALQGRLQPQQMQQLQQALDVLDFTAAIALLQPLHD